MICNLDPQYGSECNDCGCAQCPPGQTSDGTGLVTYCPNQYGDSGCYVASVSFCAGYTNVCPELGNGFLCKDEQQNCGGITGCTKVKACNIETGETQYLASGNCHMENDTCYSNTRACSGFSSLVYNFGQVTCLTQSGSAVWNSGKWDVSGCSCDVPSVSNNLNDYFRCTQFGTHVGLYPNQNVQSVDNSILYMVDRLYCEKCPAGYLPTITDASSGDIYARPENTSGNWGVITCGIQVQAPDYAPGCVINFNLSMDGMMAECRKTCPDGFATEAPGATNVGECQYDEHTTYTDDTGTFYIRSLDDCP